MAFGLKVGPGGTVTQATSKSTAVSVNGLCGQITTHNASLGATTSVAFTVNNGNVAANSVVVASIASGATVNSYSLTVDAVAAGSFRLSLRNYTAGALGEAIVINFSIIRNGI